MFRVLFAIIGAIANAAYYTIIKNHITDRDPRILTALGFFISGVLLLSLGSTGVLTVGGAVIFLLFAQRGGIS